MQRQWSLWGWDPNIPQFLIQNSYSIFTVSNPNFYYENEIKQALTLAMINKQYYNYGTTQLNSRGQVQKKNYTTFDPKYI